MKTIFEKLCGKYFVLLINLLLLINCSDKATNPLPQVKECSAEELKVFGTILDNIKLPSNQNVILLKDSTITPGSYAIREYSYFYALEEDTYNSFDACYNNRVALGSIPPTQKEYVYFLSKYNGSYYDANVYRLFFFSRVGFNKNQTQAFVFVSEGSYQNAKEYYLILENINNVWEIKSNILIGMS